MQVCALLLMQKWKQMHLTAKCYEIIVISARCADLERTLNMCHRHLPTVTFPPEHDCFIAG
jgi:hypothetical protein